ncbi:MAG: hypothetical protein WCV62_00495 [Candidatus Peribacteraceae bacterium]|jgi:hypothetical protein
MLSSISDILDDLYRIDPTLREHETELIPLLEKLIKHRPDVKPDETFVRELRSRLLALAREDSLAGQNTRSPFFSFFTMQRTTPILAGLVLGALLAAPATYYVLRPGALPLNEKTGSPLFSYSITKEAAPQAFGDLPAIASPSAAQGRGGGGGGDAAMIAPDGILPAYTQYEYVYEGELPTLPQAVDVLQRERRIAGPAITSLLKGFNMGMVDLGSFPNAALDSMTFSQGTDFGYMVNLLLRDGQIGIAQDWERWPHPEAVCKDEACYKRYRPTIDDVPSDDRLISTAAAFLAEHQVDLSHYGEPEVDMNWRQEYERAAVKSDAFIPDSVRVLYPLLVEGKPVYDMGGTKSGIGVSVHLKHNRVSDVWGLQNQTYKSSSYAGVQDAESVKTYLKNMEKLPYRVLAEQGTQEAKITTVTLGEPHMGYTLVYQQDGVSSRELFVPALIFPVLNPPQDYSFYRSSIAVPLAKDIIDKQKDGPLFMQ